MKIWNLKAVYVEFFAASLEAGCYGCMKGGELEQRKMDLINQARAIDLPLSERVEALSWLIEQYRGSPNFTEARQKQIERITAFVINHTFG